MLDLESIGREWAQRQTLCWTDSLTVVSPSEFTETHRYLPPQVTALPGPMSFDVAPFAREIVDCFDVDSPVREVTLKKGVQVSATTIAESVLLYFMAHVRNRSMMFVTADKELATMRVENNIIPMLQQSGFEDIFQSSDIGNTRKTGKTGKQLQFRGGGYLIPEGANNADKMRSSSIAVMVKDELDAWPDFVGRDGDPDKLTSDRLSAFWGVRKIFRTSTPLIKDASKIDVQFKRGDQRRYYVRCFSCDFEQTLRWSTVNKETGMIGGFLWELEGEQLILESVRWACSNCGHEHFEHDKTRLFSPENGARWKPTAIAKEPEIRSYHLPAFYSTVGLQPWSKCVSDYLEAFDPDDGSGKGRVRDIKLYQTFYNNVLGEPFEQIAMKVRFENVSGHRLDCYSYGMIPNAHAVEHGESAIMFLTCLVDVHLESLAVGVIGWSKGSRAYLIDYFRFEDDDCTETSSPVWGQLRELIETKRYTADDGKEYGITMTLIDAGFANSTVLSFTSSYEHYVYPVLGRDRPAKSATIREFQEWAAQDGQIGFKIVVDHYKDRLAPVLRREWYPENGGQKEHHFNAPLDATDKQLKELTVEQRRKKMDEKGTVSYYWHRPGNAPNELWDILVYGHASVEILAWLLCIKHFELETVDWVKFWNFIEDRKLYFSEPTV